MPEGALLSVGVLLKPEQGVIVAPPKSAMIVALEFEAYSGYFSG
jgi:hypothetical protein